MPPPRARRSVRALQRLPPKASQSTARTPFRPVGLPATHYPWATLDWPVSRFITVEAEPPGPAVRRRPEPSATMASAGAWAPPPDWLESAATGTGSPTLREDPAPAVKSH